MLRNHQAFNTMDCWCEYISLRSQPFEIAAQLTSVGAKVESLGVTSIARLPLAVLELRRTLRQRRPDIVHAHLPLAGVVTRVAALGLGIPVVYTEHNVNTAYQYTTRFFNWLTWRMQAAVISISDDVTRELPKNGVVATHRVPNGVDLTAFFFSDELRKQCRCALDIPHSDFVIGTVASMRPQKRLERFVRAVDSFCSSYPRASALIVGDGPEMPALKNLSSSLPNGGRLRFVGSQEHVHPYLCAMDVFMITSDFEGAPVAPLEAMAAELPVVGTDVRGLRETIEPGVTGYTVRNDADIISSLAKALSVLANDAQQRKTMGKAGRRRVAALFSAAPMTRRTIEIYQELIGLPVPSGLKH